jgi:non-heme chloroperoxidase
MARHSGFKVNKLVLMGAAVPSFVQRPGYPYGMTTQQLDGIIADAYNNRPKMCAAFGRMCFAQNHGAEYMNWFTNLATSAAGYATVQCAESLRDEDLRCDLAAIRVPTAIFHGLCDQVCPYPFAEEMRKGIADSFIVPFEHSGHCLYYEERDKCNGALVDFVNG